MSRVIGDLDAQQRRHGAVEGVGNGAKQFAFGGGDDAMENQVRWSTMMNFDKLLSRITNLFALWTVLGTAWAWWRPTSAASSVG